MLEPIGDHMNRRSLSCDLTEEERLTCVKWRRGMAIFYGCMALLVLGVIALTTARADEISGALYPARYVTNCRPAPVVGCVCETDEAGQTPPLSVSTDGGHD